MLPPPTGPRIGAINQSVLIISTSFIQSSQAQNSPTTEEVITITTAYNAGDNRTPLRNSRTGVYNSTPVNSKTTDVYGGSGISAVCPSPAPCSQPSVIWDNSIENIRKSNTPNLKETKKLNTAFDRNFTIVPYISSQILGYELSDSSSCNFDWRCRMNFSEENGQLREPQFVSHGIPTIDTLDKNYKIWRPATRIRRKPCITHWSSTEHDVGKGTAVGDAVADYKKANYKTGF